MAEKGASSGVPPIPAPEPSIVQVAPPAAASGGATVQGLDVSAIQLAPVDGNDDDDDDDDDQTPPPQTPEDIRELRAIREELERDRYVSEPIHALAIS
jgi:hypothetical protein